MQRVLFIFQKFLKCGLVFLIAFVWLRFLLSSVWLAGLISFAITLVIELFSLYLNKKSKNKTSLKIKEKEDAENMFLSLLSDKNYLSFFHELSLSRHSNCKKKKEYILIEHKDQCKVILYPYIKLKSLIPDDILNIYKTCLHEKACKIVIICNEYDKSCLGFIKNLSQNFILLDKFESYSMLYKEYEFYPEITLQYKKDAKLKFKDMLAVAFNKSKTKGYIFSALVIFITSYFVKMNIYYCIIGSLLLLFALISFINPKYNKVKKQTIL